MHLNVTFSDYAGLGNRIKGLVSLIRSTFKSGDTYSLFWDNTERISCDYNDLFDFDIDLLKYSKDARFRLHWKFIVSPAEMGEEWIKNNENKLPSLDLLYGETPDLFKESFLRAFSVLKPKKELNDRAEEIVSEDRLKIGVHVRNDSEWNKMGREIPLEDYFEKIDSLDLDVFFLSCHDSEIAAKFIERYGSSVVIQKDKECSGTRKKRMEDAMVDMLVLSKMKLLICDAKSTFSECAWWFGGAQAQVFKMYKGASCLAT